MADLDKDKEIAGFISTGNISPHKYRSFLIKENYKRVNAEELKKKASKTKWSLLPWQEMEEVAMVFTKGAEKYTPEGWKHCDKELYKDAIFRHLIAWATDEQCDKESGFSHLSHVIANALILKWLDKPEDIHGIQYR